MAEKGVNSYDLNGQNFDSDLYLQKLLKECSLRQIMDKETEIIKDTQNLHSDMQTLVYENYNKFISATDTVRKMKTDFKKMEDEMDLLASNMDSITTFSEQISSTLQDTRQQITKLSGIHSLLKRLQFLFKLPTKLKAMMEEKNYNQAVQDYIHAQRVLQQYGNMASFQGIQEDCNKILTELKQKLRDQFKSSHATAKELAESVDLLLQLDEPADKLCKEFLDYAEHRLEEQLVLLQDLSEQKDIIEFVDLGISGFLSDLCLVVGSYNDMFISRIQLDDVRYSEDFETKAVIQLNEFIAENMKRYFAIVQSRVDLEQDVGDTVVLVRALDRFHRRLQAMNTICKEADFAKTGTDIVINAGRKQCKAHLVALKLHFSDALTRVRQALAAPKVISQENDSSSTLPDLLTSLVLTTVEKIKGILQDLLVFIKPDITFGLKQQFRESFCVENLRENLIVAFLNHLIATARGFCDNQTGYDPKCPPSLLLVLSKMCLEFQSNSVHYLLSQTDELFEISGCSVTAESEINKNLQEAAQDLLNYYVRMQGLNVSQMLRKSVETRDWLHTIEPRTVRAVMKRVVEDIAAVESTVGVLFEDGTRTEHSSDSSRKTHSYSVSRHQFRSNWSSYTPNQLDSSIVSNIHKLFSERIEIFSAVEFSKNSILTGIIKISLKTFLECVRLKTFSKYGLQQIQVDTHYLQLYLWRFVADENLVHFLLDEILGSAVHRCLEPVLMEPSVVEIICDRG